MGNGDRRMRQDMIKPGRGGQDDPPDQDGCCIAAVGIGAEGGASGPPPLPRRDAVFAFPGIEDAQLSSLHVLRRGELMPSTTVTVLAHFGECHGLQRLHTMQKSG